jgi:hypothetical protein
MNLAKVLSVVNLANVTTVASFLALMIIQGTMPLIQMTPFIGLSCAIVRARNVYFKTKGDNNPSVGLWTISSGDVIGRQTVALKGVGNYFLWMKTPVARAILAVVSIYVLWPNQKDFGRCEV